MLTLSPQARAVAAFVLGYALLAGYLDRLGLAASTVIDGVAGSLSAKSEEVVVHFVSLLAGILVLMIAARAVTESGPGWERTLGQAAALITLVGIVIAGLALLGVLFGGAPRFY